MLVRQPGNARTQARTRARTHTQKQRHAETETQKQRHMHTDTQTHRHTDNTHTHRDTDRQANLIFEGLVEPCDKTKTGRKPLTSRSKQLSC